MRILSYGSSESELFKSIEEVLEIKKPDFNKTIRNRLKQYVKELKKVANKK